MTPHLKTSILRSISDVAPDDWDRLTGEYHPFVEHGFLDGLESSGSVGGRETGWVPQHVVVHAGGELVGAVPLYRKYDSYGEYIFDWGWARAAQMAGLPYYPKLVGSVPFTPATGPRLLVQPSSDRAAVIDHLVRGIETAGEQCNSSSTHMLFLTEEEQLALTERDFLPRSSYQFHWERDPHWQCFDDYLGSLRSSARKQIKRERRRAASHGLTIAMHTGDTLGDAEWSALWTFYQHTCGRKWGTPYLTHGFFLHLRRHFAHRIVAAFAHDGDKPIAGALLLTKGNHLYGRYWGTRRQLDSMHFELCYYTPIEWALKHGVDRFEAGAQGEHKLKRGFLPTLCRSSHRMGHPALAHAVEEYLPRESEAVEHDIAFLSEHSPFRRDG